MFQKKNIPWKLGNIKEGWEWLAFTFQDQEQISLSAEEIENMVETADSVVRQAYARMNIDTTKQSWMKNTKKEIDYIFEKGNIKHSDLIYDLGCGIGRHSLEMAKRGRKVIGIDYVEENIKAARSQARVQGLNSVEFIYADCRKYTNDNKGKLVLCLYDVVGSFANITDNLEIIQTAYNLLENNGIAVFFSYEL